MKRVLVSGYIGFKNFGDEAIFYALSSHLKTMGYDISVLCGNVEEVQQKYQVEAHYFKDFKAIIKEISKCDILISGGGSLLQNKTSNFSLFYYLGILFLAKIFNKKTIIFAQGIEPIVGKIPEKITKAVLKNVDFITLRDKKSVKLLKSWGIGSILVSDPAYSLVENTEISKLKDGLIVQLRSFRGMTQKFISNLALYIVKNYRGKISVFSFQDEIDEKICLDFIEELKKHNVIAEYISNKSVQETIEIINNAKYIISTRLHGLIIATALQTKTFGICYDEKIKTLTSELEIENIDILNYTKEEMDKKLINFFNNHSNKPVSYRKFEWDYIDKALKRPHK